MSYIRSGTTSFFKYAVYVFVAVSIRVYSTVHLIISLLEGMLLNSTPDTQSGLRELGDEAVWTLSSAKPGNGVEQLRDESLSTYWQSDGTGPHLINIQFLRKMSISSINLYLNYVLDESYTPKRISVLAGSTLHDMVDVTTMDLNEPSGWVLVPLSSQDVDCPGPLRTHVLQVCLFF